MVGNVCIYKDYKVVQKLFSEFNYQRRSNCKTRNDCFICIANKIVSNNGV